MVCSRITITWVCALVATHLPQPRFRVDAHPVVEIPAVTPAGAVNFEHAAAGTVLASGEVLVADGSAGVLRVFDAHGAPLRTVGRRGVGPGEFQYISWVGRCRGDSIVVWDFALRRLTILDPQARFVRQTPPTTGVSPFTLACSRYGPAIIAHGWGATTRPSGNPIYRGRAPLVLLDSTGSIAHTIDTVNSGELAVIGGGAGPRPLGKYTYLAMSRSTIFVATNDSAVLSTYSLRGLPTGTIRTEIAGAAPTARQVDRAVDAALAFAPAPLRDRLRSGMRAIPPPTQLPPFSGLLVDPIDVLWVVLSFPGENITRLRALDARGATLGEVSVPADLVVLEVGRDYVLGLAQTDDGDEVVRQYRLRRG